MTAGGKGRVAPALLIACRDVGRNNVVNIADSRGQSFKRRW
jgi:hypothetical protein